jgi:hypothetical protein
MDVDSAGQARIEHRIRYEVVSGMLQGFDWKGVSEDVGIDGDVIIESESDPQATARAERDDKGVHIRVDGTKGLKRGTHVFVVRCSMDLVGTKALRRDGSLWRLDWTGADGAPMGLRRRRRRGGRRQLRVAAFFRRRRSPALAHSRGAR